MGYCIGKGFSIKYCCSCGGTRSSKGRVPKNLRNKACRCRTKWEEFTRRTSDPKLKYIEKRLDEAGIPHRRHGHSFHAPILDVQEDRLAEAWAILSEKLGRRTLDDIPDDDPLFAGA